MIPERVQWLVHRDHGFRVLLLPCCPQRVDLLPLDHKLAARAPAIGLTHAVFEGRTQGTPVRCTRLLTSLSSFMGKILPRSPSAEVLPVVWQPLLPGRLGQ